MTQNFKENVNEYTLREVMPFVVKDKFQNLSIFGRTQF